MYSTNLAADICLPKMVAELSCFHRTQNGSFFPPKIIGIHFTFITKIPGGTLLTKMPAESPTTEQIFTETNRLVPLMVPVHQRTGTAESTLDKDLAVPLMYHHPSDLGSLIQDHSDGTHPINLCLSTFYNFRSISASQYKKVLKKERRSFPSYFQLPKEMLR